jgi:hypothetical protein
MRNCIPDMDEVTMIEDFYHRSNDSAFVYITTTTSKQLFREADVYITAD